MPHRTVWVITGASRGIGHELSRQISRGAVGPALLIATARNPEQFPKLASLKSDANPDVIVHVLRMDTSDEESIFVCAKEVMRILEGRGVDYLINNAAITGGNDRAFDFSKEVLLKCLTTNVVGPALVSKYFLELVLHSKKKVIVNFTTGLASFELDHGPKNASYTISKCALNMLTYKQATQRNDIIAICIDPGWVQTDMGGINATLTVEESVEHILNTVRNLTHEHSGKFLNYEGQIQPW